MNAIRQFNALLILFSLGAVSTLGQTTPCDSVGWKDLAAILQRIIPPKFPDRQFNITEFGAVADGKTECTSAIAEAIDECTRSGGGRVVVPAGTFLTGAIHLKSNVNLHLLKGATLLFDINPAKFLPVVFTRWEGVECMNYSPLIYAFEQQNIAVTGEGVLDGRGSESNWWAWKSGKPSQKNDRDELLAMAERGVPPDQRIFGDGHYLRPNFFQPYRCKNVLLQGVTFRNSPMWFIHPVLSENITVENVTVEGSGPNNDGCDPESCTDVLIRGCTFNTGDDCIAIKSGRNTDGRRVNVPTSNIVIQQCMMKDGHGGVVIGSEVSGGVRNVFAEDCTMDSPLLDRALRFKTNSVRGGFIENFFARRIKVGQVAEAVVKVDFYYEEGDAGKFTPTMKNVHVSDLSCERGQFAFWIKGYERSPVSCVEFENCTFRGIKKPSVLEHVSHATFRNVTINDKPIFGDEPWSQRIARSVLTMHPDSIVYATEAKSRKWNYEQGLMLEALWRTSEQSGNQQYETYARRNLDYYVGNDGSIDTYKLEDFNLDNIAPGLALLRAYAATKDAKYKRAADTLRHQLALQPRTKEGGFWHKKIYPSQMWLDGLYMAEPFYVQYAHAFGSRKDFDDIANQFIWIEQHARDAATGLLYHAWDESKQQKWANPATGSSPNFWARAMGWYAMALVDVLDDFPKEHPKRAELVGIFQRLSRALAAYRDPASGLLYQVVDQGRRPGNYLEASGSAMMTYAFAKGTRQGLLGSNYFALAGQSFQGITRRLVSVDERGLVSLHETCSGAGLGGNPYRDGSYEYYINEPRRTNDFKGVGPFLLAALELEKGFDLKSIGRNKVVGLDYYYNCEWKKTDAGKVQFHYVWEDTTNSGFSELGELIRTLGATTTAVSAAPRRKLLDKVSVYVIVDPDTRTETESPHFIENREARVIADWVKAGGVLVLLANDSANCEFQHLNGLAERFGMHFNGDSRHRVVGNNYDQGKFVQLPAHPIFDGVGKIYLKEISSLRLQSPATAILTENGMTFMAVSKLGKGTVFAVGDPWIYNEYIGTRRLPADYENGKAGRNLFEWLLGVAAPRVH
ncbi:MAG: DUF4350 domain-containing protein [Bacteroidota bacterium]